MNRYMYMVEQKVYWNCKDILAKTNCKSHKIMAIQIDIVVDIGMKIMGSKLKDKQMQEDLLKVNRVVN